METVMWWICMGFQSVSVLFIFRNVMRHGMGYPIPPRTQLPKDQDFIGDLVGLGIVVATVYFLLLARGYV